MIDGLVLEMAGLPDKPKDAAGRLVKWVLLCQEPGFVYQDRRFDVGPEFIKEQLKDFARLTSNGYSPPLLREHTHNGERSGDVLQLAETIIDGRAALIGAVAFSDAEASDKIKRGELKYISPAFGPLQDDTGHKYDFVLREVSLVASPHQKNMSPGVTHILGSEQVGTMPDNDNDTKQLELETSPPELAEEEEGASVEDRLAGLEAGLSALMAAVESITAAEDDPAEEPEEELIEEGETAALRERIGALEMERDVAIWDTDKPSSLKFTPELAKVLFKAWRQDKESVHAILSEATIVDASPRPEQSSATPVNPFAVRMSEPSAEPVDAVTSDADLSSEALRIADGDQSKALAIYRKLKSQTLN